MAVGTKCLLKTRVGHFYLITPGHFYLVITRSSAILDEYTRECLAITAKRQMNHQDGQQPKGSPIMGPFMHEIIAPDVVLASRS